MEKVIEEFEQQKKKIEENLEYIKNNLSKQEGPIFIELLGTAKSGKTTLLTYLNQLFKKQQIPFEAKQETAEYNPIENKRSEEYEMWMIMELMQNLSLDLSNKTPRVIVYDRGMLDRIPWLDFNVMWGSVPLADSILLKELYKSEFVRKYEPLAYGFVTSPELSVLRKGKPGRIVNIENMTKFNLYMEKEEQFLESISSKYSIIKTDPYQGELQKFIMDTVETITKDITERIRGKEIENMNKGVEENIER